MLTRVELVAALKRALRTYIVIAGPLILALAVANIDGSQPLDFAAWKVVLLSGVPATLTFLWNAYLDPSRIPSITVKVPQPPGEVDQAAVAEAREG